MMSRSRLVEGLWRFLARRHGVKKLRDPGHARADGYPNSRANSVL